MTCISKVSEDDLNKTDGLKLITINVFLPNSNYPTTSSFIPDSFLLNYHLNTIENPQTPDEIRQSLLKHLKKWTREGCTETPKLIMSVGDSDSKGDLVLNNEESKIFKIPIHHKSKVVLLPVTEINYIFAKSNYTEVNTDTQKYSSTKTLKSWETLLSESELFIRVNKSAIIKKSYCKHYLKGKSVRLVLKNNQVVILSRRRKAGILKKLKNNT